MHFVGIDHIVLTIASIEKTLWFYCEILGMEEVNFGKDRKAVRCGNQKIKELYEKTTASDATQDQISTLKAALTQFILDCRFFA